MLYLITGGAGFIGCNYAHRLLARGDRVRLYDNLSRVGSAANLDWLRDEHGPLSFDWIRGDVRSVGSLREAMRNVDVIVHLAAQTAVTTSVQDPRADFNHNALGTLNVLEAMRETDPGAILLYASTNKVYGAIEDAGVVEEPTRYAYDDQQLQHGISEEHPMDFYSPYGCSKGTGDQYTRDYARIYDLRTVVFRQSCIYGPRQMGVEDQGWLAWFLIAAATGKSITIYGDGKQVRDVLYIDDLLDVYDAAVEQIALSAGQVYNIGGGPSHTISIWQEFRPLLEELVQHPVPVSYEAWRPGDQLVYVSDIRKANRELDWTPKVAAEEGLQALYDWIVANKRLFA